VPAYSELYSLDKESSSENEKLLSAIRSVRQSAGSDKVVVADRGADREGIMNRLLKDKQQVIIRQVGNRDLYVAGQRTPFKQVSRSVKLTETYRVSKNRQVKESYSCGAVTVKLTPTGEDLWLVVMKEKRRGYCWLLCHLKEKHKRAAIAEAFKGYGHRWKIEEVHRQIKMDYDLEKICLQRYEALKSLNALLWTAVSFLYTRLDNISLDIITHIELGLQNRKTWFELIRFIYYKLALAVKKLLAVSRLYISPVLKIPVPDQLCLTLGCP